MFVRKWLVTPGATSVIIRVPAAWAIPIGCLSLRDLTGRITAYPSIQATSPTIGMNNPPFVCFWLKRCFQWKLCAKNASSKCLVRKWLWWIFFAFARLVSWGLESSGAEILCKGFLEICYSKRRCLDQAHGVFASCRDSTRRALDCCCAKSAAATQSAFALWSYGGDRVVTWGHPKYGGDSSAVQDHLRNVRHIQATPDAFAAILADGSVVTWGDPVSSGDSSAVRHQLNNVQHIQATHASFAAILADGSVVTWGPSKVWWWPLCSSRSSQERAAHSGYCWRICRRFGHGINRHVGQSKSGRDSSAVQCHLL